MVKVMLCARSQDESDPFSAESESEIRKISFSTAAEKQIRIGMFS